MKKYVIYYRPMKDSQSLRVFPDLGSTLEEAESTKRYLKFHQAFDIEIRNEEVSEEQIAEHNSRGVMPAIARALEIGKGK